MKITNKHIVEVNHIRFTVYALKGISMRSVRFLLCGLCECV